MIKYRKVVGGPLETNTYLVYSEDSGIIVDPGAGLDAVMETVKELGVKISLAIATHGHFDHVFYAGRVSKLLNVKLLIHKLDVDLISRHKFLAENLYGDVLEPPEFIELVNGDTVLRLDEELKIEILHTPGHTRGSLCVLIGNLFVSGDTLFKGTIGRTDFPESSAKDMKISLTKLVKLPGDYVVLPGHGEVTTLEHERRTNPYLRRLLK